MSLDAHAVNTQFMYTCIYMYMYITCWFVGHACLNYTFELYSRWLLNPVSLKDRVHCLKLSHTHTHTISSSTLFHSLSSKRLSSYCFEVFTLRWSHS